MAASAVAATEVTVDLTARGIQDWGGAVEAGVQDKKGDLIDGSSTRDGTRRFTFPLKMHAAEDGSVDWTGPFAHGKKGERFAYISYRPAGGGTWNRRTKIMLPTRLPADLDKPVAGISATILDRGVSRVAFERDWTFE